MHGVKGLNVEERKVITIRNYAKEPGEKSWYFVHRMGCMGPETRHACMQIQRWTYESAVKDVRPDVTAVLSYSQQKHRYSWWLMTRRCLGLCNHEHRHSDVYLLLFKIIKYFMRS
jgi:Ni,Fe-hydrogenase I small subunit